MHALIGYSGFVGSHLHQAGVFDALFNSTNFRDMARREFDLMVCAGVSAAKWVANRQPEQDQAQIHELMETLSQTRAREFILISTIDVYPDPSCGGDETEMIDENALSPYGRHRFALEKWVREQFPLARIIRLPALFGPGLKKNALYDLLNQNQIDRINPLASFQWYPITHLWQDLLRVRAFDLTLVNLFTQPISMRTLLNRFFLHAAVGAPKEPAPRYHLRTRYAEQFGGANGFIMSSDACLHAIGEYIADEQSQRAKAL